MNIYISIAEKGSIFRKLFHLSLLIAVCALPFANFLAHFFVPAIISAIVLLIAGEGSFPGWKKITLFLLPVAYYLFYFFSWMDQSNAESRFQIELKMSFVILPLIFLFIPVFYEQIREIFRYLLLSIFVSSVLCFAKAFWLAAHGDLNALFSSALSIFHHPSYLSMYIVFALFFMMNEYLRGRPLFKSSGITWFLLIYLSIFNFLLASKMGWITFLLLSIWMICTEMVKRKKTMLMLLSLSALTALSYAAYRFVPSVNAKVNNLFSATHNEQIDKSTTESSAVRVLIWKSASELNQRHFWNGVGSAAAKDSLKEVYRKNGYTGALEKNLNAHNQFLESFIAFGFPGFLMLCLLFVLPLLLFSGKFPLNGFWFLLILIINCVVESMFQNQNGVVFFIFFYCLFFISFRSAPPVQQNYSHI